jgi:1,2-diacylglycerol 3-alpha-glucosyltransferase
VHAHRGDSDRPARRSLRARRRRALPRAHGIALDRPLLLYVGRVAHEKNIEFLLHSFVVLRRSRPDAMLAIAGEGPARAQLQGLASRLGIALRIAIHRLSGARTRLADCYAAADVFVFASRTETQGLVLLEALAQGRPVVSTAILGTASILQPGCGARVAPEKPDVFAKTVLDVLDDPQRAARLSAQGLDYARSWASMHMAWRLAKLYRELKDPSPASTTALAAHM